MIQLDLFRQPASEPEIPCHWGNEWCHDCGWCEGGLLLASDANILRYLVISDTAKQATGSDS